MSEPKPRDYGKRRAWQDAARKRGEVPECGREACHNAASPAWLNRHTPLIYCGACADLINSHCYRDAPLCYPEAADA